MRPMTRQFNPVYEALCVNMTLLEQKQLFGTCGIKNILAKYTKADAIMMANNYLSRRDGTVGESRNENSNYIQRRDNNG